MDEAEPDVLAYVILPKEHRAKLHNTNSTEHLNSEMEEADRIGRCLPERQRHYLSRLPPPPRAERRVGRPACPLHDAGNYQPDDR